MSCRDWVFQSSSHQCPWWQIKQGLAFVLEVLQGQGKGMCFTRLSCNASRHKLPRNC